MEGELPLALRSAAGHGTTLLDLLQQPGVGCQLLRLCATHALAALRGTCKGARWAVQDHCTCARWDGRHQGALHGAASPSTTGEAAAGTAGQRLKALVAGHPGLLRLDVVHAGFAAAGAEALAQLPLRTLQQLELPFNAVCSAAAAALARAHWPALRQLNLFSNKLGPEGTVLLAAAPCPMLQHLDLGSNALGAEGAAALAQAPWPALHHLRLTQNGLDDEGVCALAQATWPALRTLHLHNNNIGALGAALITRTAWPVLQELDLAFNHLREEGVAALALDGRRCPGLQRLNLRVNCIEDYEGVEAAVHVAWPMLVELKLTRIYLFYW